jgi:hypothetical protein
LWRPCMYGVVGVKYKQAQKGRGSACALTTLLVHSHSFCLFPCRCPAGDLPQLPAVQEAASGVLEPTEQGHHTLRTLLQAVHEKLAADHLPTECTGMPLVPCALPRPPHTARPHTAPALQYRRPCVLCVPSMLFCLGLHALTRRAVLESLQGAREDASWAEGGRRVATCARVLGQRGCGVHCPGTETRLGMWRARAFRAFHPTNGHGQPGRPCACRRRALPALAACCVFPPYPRLPPATPLSPFTGGEASLCGTCLEALHELCKAIRR